jgi:nitroreductase
MFTEQMRNRRSVRKFISQPVEETKLAAVVEAALRAPSGRGARPWELVVVDDRQLLDKLSVAKPGGAAFLKQAAVGIVVCGNSSQSHLWLEDCAIVAVTLQYAAHSLGLGSCWTHIRGNNYDTDGTKSSTAYIAELLGLPAGLEVECIIGFGYPGEETVPYKTEDLHHAKVSRNRHGSRPN